MHLQKFIFETLEKSLEALQKEFQAKGNHLHALYLNNLRSTFYMLSRYEFGIHEPEERIKTIAQDRDSIREVLMNTNNDHITSEKL